MNTNTNPTPEAEQEHANYVAKHSPILISLEEWKEIAKIETVIDGWGLHDWSDDERPEVLSGSVYGVKFNFTSGCPGYCGDLYILLGDTYEEPLMLLRHSKTGKLFTYCPSWGTYGDAPERLPSRVSLWHKDARRIYDTISHALMPDRLVRKCLSGRGLLRPPPRDVAPRSGPFRRRLRGVAAGRGWGAFPLA